MLILPKTSSTGLYVNFAGKINFTLTIKIEISTLYSAPSLLNTLPMRTFHLDVSSISPSIHTGGGTTTSATTDPIWWAHDNHFDEITLNAAAKKIFVKMCRESNILTGTFSFSIIELVYPPFDDDEFYEVRERYIFEGTKTALETPRIIERHGARFVIRSEYTIKQVKNEKVTHAVRFDLLIPKEQY